MCFLFNNVNFLFLLLFIINVKSDDDGVVQNENRSEKFRRKSSISDVNHPEISFRNNLGNISFVGSKSVSATDDVQQVDNPIAPKRHYESLIDRNHSSVNLLTSENSNSKNGTDVSKHVNDDINKTTNDTNSTTINKPREIDRNRSGNKNNSNDLYYEILQTKPNATVWSKFEFLIKPFVDDKTKVEESNGIIFSKRKNLTLGSNSSVTINNISNKSESENISNKTLTQDYKTLVRTERNATDSLNITDRHFNNHNKFNQDSWTQVSTLQSNKDQIDRFKYPSHENNPVQNQYSSIKPTENLSNLDKSSDNFNSLKRHTLATLHNKHSDNFYSNIHSPSSGSTASPSYYSSSSSNPNSIVSSSSLSTISTSPKPFGSPSSSSTNSKDHLPNKYQTASTKTPYESQKQIASGFGQVVSTTHKSWINNIQNQNKQSVSDYYSAIITAADAIKKKHKPVSSTETVLFPYYDEELVTPVLISSTKKPIHLSSTTKKPLFVSSTKKPFNPVITLTKKPDFEYQSEVDNEEEEEEEEENEQNEEEAAQAEEDVEYEETTTQQPATKKPPKPLFVSSTAKPVFTKRPYIIRPVINVISQPVSSTRKPILTYKPSTTTTTTTTTTQAPPTTEKQLTTAIVTVPSTPAVDTNESEDEDDDESDDSDASEERKRRRKPNYPYLTHPHHNYPLIQTLSSPAPFLVYQQPIQQVDEEADKNNDSGDDEDEDDDFFVNPLDDDEDEDEDEIVEETVEVHKSPHGHIYDDYPLLSKKKKKKLFKKKKHGFKLKDFKKLKKFMLPLLLAYKLKFFTMVPLLLGGLVLIVGTTGIAGFFFALFAVGLGLKGHK